MRICFISDTHSRHESLNNRLPMPDDCDVLVHCGDYSGRGSEEATRNFIQWLDKQQKERFPYVVFIAGNHDFIAERDPDKFQEILDEVNNPNIYYLNNSEVTIEGVKFWGSPWSPWFHNWAFNAERGDEIAAIWSQCPDDTDVMITHSPLLNILDKTRRGEHVGCWDLRHQVFNRIRPKIHSCGHIHEDYGQVEEDGIQFANASICTLSYSPDNDPIILELKEEKTNE